VKSDCESLLGSSDKRKDRQAKPTDSPTCAVKARESACTLLSSTFQDCGNGF